MLREPNPLYEDLRLEIGRIPLVDAHDHLPSEKEWLSAQPASPTSPPAFQREPDFSSLLGYAYWDLVSAGMPKDALRPGMSGQDKWARVSAWWEYVRHMGSGILCRRALSMFCGVDDLTAETVPIVEEKIRGLRVPGIYRRLLKGEFNFAVCVNTPIGGWVDDGSASEFFAPLLYAADLAMPQRRGDLAELEKASGQGIYSLATYLRALDTVLEQAERNGMVGIKWHRLAYLRNLHYPPADPRDAEQGLERILRMPAAGGVAGDTPVGFDEMIPFQNFIQHYLVRRAIDLDMPVQIHCGTLGGSNGAQVSHTNPTHLVDLFLQYPQARFDLLHAGYPYMAETTALVKLFPNAYLNTAWFDLLSPRIAREFLQDWMSSLPLNKMFAFGGDHKNVLLVCAYADMVRDNLADILAEEVCAGAMSEKQALGVAARLLRENAWQFFRLQERWASRWVI
jgi:uncharacterized protein